MENLFSINQKFHYSSLESLFRFVRLHFLTPLMGDEYIKKFTIDTNFKHLGTSEEIQQQKSVEFLPEVTKEELFSMILKEGKYDRFDLAKMTDSELTHQYTRMKEIWQTEIENIKANHDKFTTPERRISISLTQDFNDEGFTANSFEKLNGSPSISSSTILENTLGIIKFTTKYVKFSGILKIFVNNNVEGYDLASQLYDMIPINKFFFIDQLFKYNIKIPQGFRSFMKLALQQTEAENWKYMQDYSKGRIMSALDGATGEHLALFFLYNSNPYIFVDSMDYNVEDKTINLSFKIEAAVPSLLTTMSSLKLSSITPLLFHKQRILIKDIQKITNNLNDDDKEYANFKLIKMDIDYLIKFQHELGLTNSEIYDIQNGYKLTVLDTTDLTLDDVEFINKYSSVEYKLEGIVPTILEDMSLVQSIDNPLNMVGYTPLKRVYIDIKLSTTHVPITDTVILANLDNDISNIKLMFRC